ncbi:hypothetical protein ASZ78_011195 [Callipepla squamata]|uniref:RRM domain-containing protein n=1 Tax=Callipepla squamata TaxID=9009 RepID=A0A226N6M1_CALSU|nr:hypothetical protein ASZ78_011195 [Callipepla squamata]
MPVFRKLLGRELSAQGEVSKAADRDNDETAKEEKAPVKEKHAAKPKAIPSLGNKNRFHPYSKEKNAGSAEKKAINRNRVFISNIPYDMKWQAIKDLMREKVGEVTYVELFKDAEGKSRKDSDVVRNAIFLLNNLSDMLVILKSVVEFKDEEFVKKALETMNKYDLSGRPLNIKEDPEGEHARRALQRGGGQFAGGHGPDIAPGLMNLPPSIVNNPNIPPEVISNLQAGRLGSTIFVANTHACKNGGLGGIGMGLGPGGQPISATQLSMGGGMGNMGPGGMGIDGPGFGGMNRMGGGTCSEYLYIMWFLNIGWRNIRPYFTGLPGFRGVEGMPNMGGFGVTRMGEMFRGGMGGNMDRDFARSEMALNRGFGDSFGRMGGAMIGVFAGGMGAPRMGPVGSGMSGGMGGMNSMPGGMGMDRMSSGFDRMGPAMGGGLDRNIEIDRGFVPGPMGGAMKERLGSKGNQIFVRNLPFDLTWQKLKEKFSQCGHVMFAEIKMENGKSKGCGTVRFDSPESAEKACRIMNGIKISGREIDVRLDRNA